MTALVSLAAAAKALGMSDGPKLRRFLRAVEDRTQERLLVRLGRGPKARWRVNVDLVRAACPELENKPRTRRDTVDAEAVLAEWMTRVDARIDERLTEHERDIADLASAVMQLRSDVRARRVA